MNSEIRKAIANSLIRIAGEMANIALKSVAATAAAVKTLEVMGLLVKFKSGMVNPLSIPSVKIELFLLLWRSVAGTKPTP